MHLFVVLSRNRPDYLSILINSMLEESIPPNDIVISDNSDCHESRNEVISFARACGIRIRLQVGLSIMEHYDNVLTQYPSSYITILHDDDYVLPGFYILIKQLLVSYPNFSAYGLNGLISNPKFTKSRFHMLSFYSFREILIFSDFLSLLFGWISPLSHGIAPFSGYTFNTHFYCSSFFDKYSPALLYYDTILVALFASKAPVLWSSKPVLCIRHHESSLTSIVSLNDVYSFATTCNEVFYGYPALTASLNTFICYRKLQLSVFRRPIEFCIRFFNYYRALLNFFALVPVSFIPFLVQKIHTSIIRFFVGLLNFLNRMFMLVIS
jgi:hypothetical protein